MTKEAKIYNGEKTASSISDAWKTGQIHVKEKLEHSLTPYTNINSKQKYRSMEQNRKARDKPTHIWSP